MILEVQHETRLEYSEPVTESVTEVRQEPVSDRDQSCHSFHLAVSPATTVHRFRDGLGNLVHHFNFLAGHARVQVLAAALVETHPRPEDLRTSVATYPVNLDGAALDVLDYLRFRGPVRQAPGLGRLVESLRPAEGSSLAALVLAVAGAIHSRFEYAPDVTFASSPVDHVLETGKGVCQDFTHLMLAILRSFGVPARYVSGYLHRPDRSSESHAWCEAWLPDLGWRGIDPTNELVVDESFVKVAIGRDFTDVPPNKGVYRGQAQEMISVRVETRTLDRLPSLSWRDQLPPLQVPLTAILSPRRPEAANDMELQQQQ